MDEVHTTPTKQKMSKCDLVIFGAVRGGIPVAHQKFPSKFPFPPRFARHDQYNLVHHWVSQACHDPSIIQHSRILESASRGIGLETTRQLLQTPTNTVFATCRSPSTATDLAALASSPGTLHIVELDVAEEASIKAGTDEVLRLLNGAGLDYILNNAAIVSRSPLHHYCLGTDCFPPSRTCRTVGTIVRSTLNRSTSLTRSSPMSLALPSSRGISSQRLKSRTGRSS